MGNQKWTIQRNWQLRCTKRRQRKTQHNVCWTPLYANKLCHPLKDYLIWCTITLDIYVLSMI